MKSAHKGLKNKKFSVPDKVVKARVCKDTGMVPVKGCPTVTDYFVKGTVPKKKCDKVADKEYLICKDTGLLAIEGVCPDIKEVKYNPEDDKDKIPKKKCNKHKKQEQTQEPEKPEGNTTPVEPEPEIPEEPVVPEPEIPETPGEGEVITPTDPVRPGTTDV